MKINKITSTIALTLIGLGSLFSQEIITTSGGDAEGIGGSSSFTVGQIVFRTNTGSNESVAQGVQQAYEISVTTGLVETRINLAMDIYPNPTAQYLTLEVEDIKGLSYELYNLSGELIQGNVLNQNSTKIDLSKYPSATYLLKTIKTKQLIKTFKIIKN